MYPELIRKKQQKSKLLTHALERESFGDYENSNRLFMEVYKKEIELANLFDGLENKTEAYHHWVSALNSAVKSRNYQIANLLLQDLIDRYSYNPIYFEELARIETKLEAYEVGKKITHHFLLKSLTRFSELQELRLSDNKLSSLPESISSLKELRTLSLWNNQLSSLPESIALLKNLQRLDLDNNELSSLPESISSLKELRTLSLWNNQLSSLPESISSLHKLRVLNLGRNQLSSLPESISSLKKLRMLNLGRNQLSCLPESISSLKELRMLRLDGKLLFSLSESMKNTLENLRKNECEIEEW